MLLDMLVIIYTYEDIIHVYILVRFTLIVDKFKSYQVLRNTKREEIACHTSDCGSQEAVCY